MITYPVLPGSNVSGTRGDPTQWLANNQGTPNPLDPSTFQAPTFADRFAGINVAGPISATGTSTDTTQTTSGGATAGSLTEYLGRGVVIVLGFIFIAAGLSLLRYSAVQAS